MLLYPRARVTVIMPLGIIFYPSGISAIGWCGFWFVLQLVSAAFTPIRHSPALPGGRMSAVSRPVLSLTPLLKSREVPLFGAVRRPWG